MNPLVSFVIPVLNGERYLARCLGAIREVKASEGSVQVLVMDNGSRDRTLAIAGEFHAQIHVIPGVTVGELRNRGAALAQGAYLAFVDCDVAVAPEWLERGLGRLADTTVAAVGAFLDTPPGGTWVQGAWGLHRRYRHRERRAHAVPWLGAANLLVRRVDFQTIGGFDASLPTTEDVDLCYRLGRRGSIVCDPAMKAIHWGEDEDIRTLWRKEVWRTSGNLRGLLAHGVRRGELPSFAYPAYVAVCILMLAFGLVRDLWTQRIGATPWLLLLLVAPAAALAGRTAWVTRKPSAMPALFALYFVYGMARAYTLLKELGGIPGRWHRCRKRSEISC